MLLSYLCSFKTFRNNLTNNADEWKAFRSSENPLETPLPEPYENSDLITKLIIFKCLRPDRLLLAIEKFMNSSFDGPSSDYNLKSLIESGSPKTPIVYLTSKGMDATFDILSLAYDMGMSDR